MSCILQYDLFDGMHAYCSQGNVSHMVAGTVKEQKTAMLGFVLHSLQVRTTHGIGKCYEGGYEIAHAIPRRKTRTMSCSHGIRHSVQSQCGIISSCAPVLL